MLLHAIAYEELLCAARAAGGDVAQFLRDELPHNWRDSYFEMADRESEIVVYTNGSFDYIFDSYQQSHPYVPGAEKLPVEARLVAAIGASMPTTKKRDDARLRGLNFFPMQTARSEWDRGHFIGHAIGGTVDGNEANVFPQLRTINRGKYRVFEDYCRKKPGVLCFSRPIYDDTTAIPVAVDFGVLRTDGSLWVETLSNRRDA